MIILIFIFDHLDFQPGCVEDMRGRGLEQRVCDGTVDCPDFSGQDDHGHVGCDDHDHGDHDGDHYEASKMSNTKMKKMTISIESNSLDL